MMPASTDRLLVVTLIGCIGLFVADVTAAQTVEYSDKDVGYRLVLPPNWTKVKSAPRLQRKLEQRDWGFGESLVPKSPRLVATFMRLDESGMSANAYILTVEFEDFPQAASAKAGRSEFFAGVVEQAKSHSPNSQRGDVRSLLRTMDGTAVLIDDRTMQVAAPHRTGGDGGHSFVWHRTTEDRAVALVATFPADGWSGSEVFREMLADNYHLDAQLHRSGSAHRSKAKAEEVGELFSQLCCLGIGLLMAAWLLWASGLLDKRNFRHLEDNEDD